jgi:uncharacterized protein YlbG (UPF0298 family)
LQIYLLFPRLFGNSDQMQASGSVTFVSKKKNYDLIDDEELKDYISQIKDQKNSLTYIKLSGNSYSKEFCEQFAALLKETPSLSVRLQFLS